MALPVRAHHAFGGEFDANRPVLLKGKWSKVEWVNPHAWIHLDGETAGWEERSVDGRRRQSQFAAASGRHARLVAGRTEIVVDGYQARDHTLKRANGRNITYPDGRKLFLGSSGTGAPTDGADPTEKKK